MKVCKLLLVVATLVVSAQSYAGKITNKSKQGWSVDPNAWKNITGPTHNNSEECPLQTKINRHQSSVKIDRKVVARQNGKHNQ